MKTDPLGVLTGTHYLDGDFACGEGALRPKAALSLQSCCSCLLNVETVSMVRFI